MKFAVGSIENDSVDVDDLVKDYFARTIASEGMPPLNFKWYQYKALEDAGMCRLFTARENDKLIGFSLYIVQAHLHHDNQIIAQCDMIGVRPENRSKGVGTALIAHAEHWFKAYDVTHMVHHHRTIYRVTPLFEDMGFKLMELSYVKEL